MVLSFSRSLEPLLALQRELDRVRDRDFFGIGTADRGTYPPIGVFKGEDDVLLTAELPGVRKEDIDIQVKGDLVRLHGERRPDYAGSEVSVHRSERTFGSFDRTVKLPYVVNADAVQATYADGILTVRLPLADAAKSKKINIG